MLKILRQNIDWVIFVLIVAGFTLVAAQRLGEVPVPQVDESYMMQTSYEMLNRGKLSLPFRRFIGGNIENNWHSLTPVHYVIQTAFFKVFGWGITEGRAFNLTLAIIVLLLVFLIGRKLFDWRVGIIAVVMMVCDVFFLERSRFLRNDYSAVMFALAAFCLYEAAERRKSWRLFLASGLTAGAAVMCHTATIYILAAISVLMLLRRGWRIVKAKDFYLFALGAFAVSAYEIISDIADWTNFRLQYRGDKRHFKLLDAMGWFRNFRHEPQRYRRWIAADLMYPDVPRTLTHLFEYLAVIAIAYLLVRMIIGIRRGNLIAEPRNRVLIVTLVVMSFFAIITSQKAVYYMSHLTPWFALVVGIMMSDGLDLMGRLRRMEWRGSRLPKFAYVASLICALIFTAMFGYQATKLYKRYITNVRNPELARFEDFKTAIRSVVPEGVCPVEVGDPVMWLAFLEHHLCFGYIEERMQDNVDIDGKEYAMIVDPRIASQWIESLAANHNHLLGELNNTPYGDLQVYYTGTDPRWLERAPLRYQFFGKRRGFASEAAIAQAQDVWSADADELSKRASFPSPLIEPEGLLVGQTGQSSRADLFVPLCSISLEPGGVYQVVLDAQAEPNQWSLLVLDEQSGARLCTQEVGEKRKRTDEPAQRLRVFDGVFRTGTNNRVIVGVIPKAQVVAVPFHVSQLRIRTVPDERDGASR
ncbi:MAG TPA: glycosyltransferase family 39 protein [Blastocatellia bacterium]|nr:glycosyltransferase family 39 protein [Blastocatellia bacterium]